MTILLLRIGERSLVGDEDLLGEALLSELLYLSREGLSGRKVTCLGVCDDSRSSSLVKLPDLLKLGSLIRPLLGFIDGKPLLVSVCK